MQYRSIAYGESLAEAKVVVSVGSGADSYVDAMAEALNSMFKAELIYRRSWPALTDVIVEASKWIGWYDNCRPYSALDQRPQVEARQEWPSIQAYAA